MAGLQAGMRNAAEGVGNEWGAAYDSVMNKPKDGQMPTGMMPMFGQDPSKPAGRYPGSSSIGKVQSGAAADPTRGGGLNVGPGFSQFMNMAQAPDMSKPQQGQDIMSLISMLQGGQMQRGRRY